MQIILHFYVMACFNHKQTNKQKRHELHSVREEMKFTAHLYSKLRSFEWLAVVTGTGGQPLTRNCAAYCKTRLQGDGDWRAAFDQELCCLLQDPSAR